MHRFVFGFVLALAVVASGCGDRRVVVRVDLLSYLDASATDFAFGPVPAAPGGLWTGEQEIVSDLEVELVEGLDSITEVENVSIAMTAIASDSTGAGTDTLRLYVSDEGVPPRSTEPAVTLPITLSPGVTDTVRVELGSDSRVAELFTGKRMRLTLTTALRGPDSGDPLNGRVRVIALDAVVVAGRGDL